MCTTTSSDFNDDVGVQQADVLGAHLDRPWIKMGAAADIPAQSELPPMVPWPHELEGIKIPMPGPETLNVLRTEFYQRAQGEQLGPSTKLWRDGEFSWAKKL